MGVIDDPVVARNVEEAVSIPPESSATPDPWRRAYWMGAGLAVAGGLAFVALTRLSEWIDIFTASIPIGLGSGWVLVRWSGVKSKRLALFAAGVGLLALGLFYGLRALDNHRVWSSLTDKQRKRITAMDPGRVKPMNTNNLPEVMGENLNRITQVQREVAEKYQQAVAFVDPELLPLFRRFKTWTWREYMNLGTYLLMVPLWFSQWPLLAAEKRARPLRLGSGKHP